MVFSKIFLEIFFQKIFGIAPLKIIFWNKSSKNIWNRISQNYFLEQFFKQYLESHLSQILFVCLFSKIFLETIFRKIFGIASLKIIFGNPVSKNIWNRIYQHYFCSFGLEKVFAGKRMLHIIRKNYSNIKYKRCAPK